MVDKYLKRDILRILFSSEYVITICSRFSRTIKKETKDLIHSEEYYLNDAATVN